MITMMTKPTTQAITTPIILKGEPLLLEGLSLDEVVTVVVTLVGISGVGISDVIVVGISEVILVGISDVIVVGISDVMMALVSTTDVVIIGVTTVLEVTDVVIAIWKYNNYYATHNMCYCITRHDRYIASSKSILLVLSHFLYEQG